MIQTSLPSGSWIATPELEVAKPKPQYNTIPIADLSAYMASIGRKGGQIGEKRRLKTMTKAERSKVAAKAAKTRWAKHVKKHS